MAEIDHNDEVARTIGEVTWDLLSSKDFPSMRAETWRHVQGRAAALLPDDEFVTLNGYYAPLLTLLTVDNRANRAVRKAYTELTGKEVPANRDPWNEYLNATLEELERARVQIHAYLARPWDQRLRRRLDFWLKRLEWRLRRGREEPDSN